MQCSESESHYSAYLEGELEGPLQERFEGHLRTCAHCQHALSEIRFSLQELRKLPAPAVPAGFPDRVVDALQPRVLRLLRLPRWVPAAAAAVLVFALGFLAARGTAPLPPVSPTVEAQLAARGLRQVAGEWLSSATLERRDRGEVWMGEEWRTPEESLAFLMEARDYV